MISTEELERLADAIDECNPLDTVAITFAAKLARELLAARKVVNGVHAAVEPVLDWYQGDEHPERPLVEIVCDAVSDLQQDRRETIAAQKVAQKARVLVGYLEIAAVMPEAINKVYIPRLDASEIESLRAALTAYDAMCNGEKTDG